MHIRPFPFLQWLSFYIPVDRGRPCASKSRRTVHSLSSLHCTCCNARGRSLTNVSGRKERPPAAPAPAFSQEFPITYVPGPGGVNNEIVWKTEPRFAHAPAARRIAHCACPRRARRLFAIALHRCPTHSTATRSPLTVQRPRGNIPSHWNLLGAGCGQVNSPRV